MNFDEYKVDLNAKCVCGCMDGKRIHNIYRFPNDYGASVISSPKGLKGAKPGFRIYVLRFESPAPEHIYSIMKNTLITTDFLECADWDEVDVALHDVYALPPARFITLG
ncbi:hypothetical protein [Methanomassiliicoccus luminyensis]|uniref:hypothetical protein n=1 Tax=Methanomassiliicoccus luminyensis TaxID=1080712 RepID=UPI00037FE7A0|nr:hypothetical protein [Methanomassiliicoccus luminyensis]